MAHERVLVVAADEVRAGGQLVLEDVVDVVAAACAQRNGRRAFRRRRPAAAGADEPRRGHAAPVRWLNAAIISSHAGSRACRPRQKPWSRRASKSASATPRCSTQVK